MLHTKLRDFSRSLTKEAYLRLLCHHYYTVRSVRGLKSVGT